MCRSGVTAYERCVGPANKTSTIQEHNQRFRLRVSMEAIATIAATCRGLRAILERAESGGPAARRGPNPPLRNLARTQPATERSCVRTPFCGGRGHGREELLSGPEF